MEEKLKKAWEEYFKIKKRKRYLEIPLVFIFSFIFIYLFLTFPAQIEKGKYFIKHLGKKEEVSQLFLPEITQGPLFLPTVKEKIKEKKVLESPLLSLENNYILIPKIGVRAPIIWNSEIDEQSMLLNLQKGVAHYKGTALPDERGNVFITGHSSYYFWDKGGYKTIFALLPKLEKGDEIAIGYQDKLYLYKVSEKFVVKPSDLWVLEKTPEPTLSLMTCVPLGTNLRRQIIRGRPIEIVEKEIKKEPEKEPFLELPQFLIP